MPLPALMRINEPVGSGAPERENRDPGRGHGGAMRLPCVPSTPQTQKWRPFFHRVATPLHPAVVHRWLFEARCHLSTCAEQFWGDAGRQGNCRSTARIRRALPYGV